MTEAQWQVRLAQISAESQIDNRTFRKACVTRGVVKFRRDKGMCYHAVYYRGRYVLTLFKDKEDKVKLSAMWNSIRVAEELINKIEGVIHEGN